jgi:hypothetical protein
MDMRVVFDDKLIAFLNVQVEQSQNVPTWTWILHTFFKHISNCGIEFLIISWFKFNF